MKTKEIIQIAVMVVLAAVLIYRKYGKRIGAGDRKDKKLPGKSLFSQSSADDNYEPYSKKNGTKEGMN